MLMGSSRSARCCRSPHRRIAPMRRSALILHAYRRGRNGMPPCAARSAGCGKRTFRSTASASFEGGELDSLEAAPWASAVDDLGLEQAVDRFGESVVVAVADTADRRFDAGLGKAFSVFDRDV